MARHASVTLAWYLISFSLAALYAVCLLNLLRSWLSPWLTFFGLFLIAAIPAQTAWVWLAWVESPWWRRYMIALAVLKFMAAIEAAMAMCYPFGKFSSQRLRRTTFGIGFGFLIWGTVMFVSSPYDGFPESVRMMRLASNIGGSCLCLGLLLMEWWRPMHRPMREEFSRHCALLACLLGVFGLSMAARPATGTEFKLIDSGAQMIQLAVVGGWIWLFTATRVRAVLPASQRFAAAPR